MGGAKIGILGAGLAGLSAARVLGGGACEVFERESTAGGLCRSRHVKGYVFDYGPHVFYTKSGFVKRLVGSALKKAGNRLAGKPRRAYIYLGGTYVKYPFEANFHPLPDVIKRECVEGARNRKAAESGSFLDWIASTFGEGIARHYMRPYNEKIWKYPLSKMNTDWIRGRVPAPSLNDIMKGADETGRKKEFGGNKHFYYPQSDGTGAIPSALSKNMGNVLYAHDASEIRRTKNGIGLVFKNGSKKRSFEKIISTLPLPELVARLEDVPGEIERAAKGLVHNSSVCVNLGIDRSGISDKHWLYFPEKKYAFNRISFPGNFSSGTVPKGKSSVLTEVTYRSGDNRPPKPKEYYVGAVVDGLRDAGILRTGEEPEAVDVAVLDYAYVVYDLQHAKNAGLIREYLKGLGIFTAGRFGEWEYLNMDGAILSGRKAAQGIGRLA